MCNKHKASLLEITLSRYFHIKWVYIIVITVIIMKWVMFKWVYIIITSWKHSMDNIYLFVNFCTKSVTKKIPEIFKRN